MQKNQETKLFFSALPNLSSLIAFRASWNETKTYPGIQPLCCRKLLFMIPEILVSPAFDNESLFIIAEVSFTSSNEFTSKLQQCQVKLRSRIEVDTELFQYCFTFSLIQKLAPSWNKVGNFFVKGCNFLQVASKIPAVSFEISVTNKICFALMPFLVKMIPPDIEDFNIDSERLLKFKQNKFVSINNRSIENPSCYVLPSLKKGRIYSITHQIPKHAPFKTYEDVKKHWNVAYGYSLPGDSCHLYYNISFFGDAILSYPEWCIRHNEPLCFWRCDQDEICTSFFNDVSAHMKNLFSSPLKFTKNSLYWQKSFPIAEDGNKSCLSKLPQNPTVSGRAAIANSTTIEKIKDGFKYLPSDQSSDCVEQKTFCAPSNNLNQASNSSSKIKNTYGKSKAFADKNDKSLYDFCESTSEDDVIDFSDSPLFDQTVPGDNMSLNIQDSHEEIFHNTATIMEHKNKNEEYTNNKKEENTPLSFECHSNTMSDAVVPDTNVPFSNEAETKKEKIIPHFGKSKKHKVDFICPIIKKDDANKLDMNRSQFTPKTSESMNINVKPSIHKPVFSTKQLKRNHVPNNVHNDKKVPTENDQKEKTLIKHTSFIKKTVCTLKDNTCSVKDKSCNIGEPTTKKWKNAPSISTTVGQKKSQISGIDLAKQILNDLKSSQSESAADIIIFCTPDSTVPSKKPRSKPKLQDVDIESMARQHNLGKVNTLTLKTWLKGKDVKCKASDKKDDLIGKVNEYLQIKI